MYSLSGMLARSRRIVPIVLLVCLSLMLVLAPPVHAWLLSLVDWAAAMIDQRATWGMIVFVFLAGISALVAFLSSAVLVPVAIEAWGPSMCFVLLWIGWFSGGLAGYAIGRFLGRPAVDLLVSSQTLGRYENWTSSRKTLPPMLLLQLAVPSDLASYLFGLVRCRFLVFALALAAAEVPYALGAVYLGASFLERRVVPLIALGVAAVLLSFWALHQLHEIPIAGQGRS
jgi:uncharacterized membrane protein YdjX (TVP38/TMEM64 family)